MRRLPTPWFLVPVLAAGVLGAVLGREVARVTCSFGSGAGDAAPGCPGFEWSAAIIGALVAAAGVAIVVNLALRSLAEWRETRAAEEEALRASPAPEPTAEPAPDNTSASHEEDPPAS